MSADKDHLMGTTGRVLQVFAESLDEFIEGFMSTWLGTLLAIGLILQWHILEIPAVREQLYINQYGTERLNVTQKKDKGWFNRNPYSSSIGRIVGVNMIVYQIYFAGLAPNPMAFTHTCIWIFFETTALWATFEVFGKPQRYPRGLMSLLSSDQSSEQPRQEPLSYRPLEGGGNTTEEGEDSSEGKEDTLITSLYMNLGRDLRVVSLFFLSQMCLMCYYIFYLNDDADSHDKSKVSGTKWVFAVIITAIAGEDEVGSNFNNDFWRVLLKHTVDDEDFWRRVGMQVPNVICSIVPFPRGVEWRIRFFMDWFMNAVCRKLLLATAPMMLCVEQPMDFIKDVLAVFFIVKLDDYADAKSFGDVKDGMEKRNVHFHIFGSVEAKEEHDRMQELFKRLDVVKKELHRSAEPGEAD